MAPLSVQSIGAAPPPVFLAEDLRNRRSILSFLRRVPSRHLGLSIPEKPFSVLT